MQIQSVEIADLNPAEYNPRKISKKQATELERSIVDFGFLDPIIANDHPDRRGVIIGGHQRFAVAKKLGYQTVPVVFVTLDADRERELNLRLNKNVGDWDLERLLDFDRGLLERVGFGDDELKKLLEPPAPKKGRTVSFTAKDPEPTTCPSCGHVWQS